MKTFVIILLTIANLTLTFFLNRSQARFWESMATNQSLLSINRMSLSNNAVIMDTNRQLEASLRRSVSRNSQAGFDGALFGYACGRNHLDSTNFAELVIALFGDPSTNNVEPMQYPPDQLH